MLNNSSHAVHPRLRQETSAQHAKLDAMLAFPPRCEPFWYKRFLTVNSAVIAVEQALAASGIQDLLPDWPDRERAAALKHDLLAMGLRTPRRPAAPIASEPAVQLGWAYVLEGSRLGARVILKFVEATAPSEIRAATHFLRHGQKTSLWSSFLEVLQRHDLNDAETARACSAAQDAFLWFLHPELLMSVRPGPVRSRDL